MYILYKAINYIMFLPYKKINIIEKIKDYTINDQLILYR